MGVGIGANVLTKVGYSVHAGQPAPCTMTFSITAGSVARIGLELAREMEGGDRDGDM